MKRYASNSLSLSPMEDWIFRTLRAVSAWAGPETEVTRTREDGSTYRIRVKTPTPRVAGGWVRDKLLNKESKDIDIALDSMTGTEYENLILAYAKANGLSDKIHHSYTVEANVEASKHLQTTTVTFDFNGESVDIDLVNLRSETYGDDENLDQEATRYPEIKAASAEIDAQRRDLTINSMFFNVDSGNIEDYVGGMEDLKQGILRTPMEAIAEKEAKKIGKDPNKATYDAAVKTFSQDPLRVLRVLRFFSRYPGSKISPAIVAAMSSPIVQQKYMQKIKPSRAGVEFQKMMEYSRPAEAIDVLFDTGFDKAVFAPLEAPPQFQKFKDIRDKEAWFKFDQQNPHHNLTLDKHTTAVMRNLNKSMIEQGLPPKIRGMMNMAAFMHDFGKAHTSGGAFSPEKGHWQYLGHADLSKEMADDALRSMGYPEKERELITKIIELHMDVHNAPTFWPENQEKPTKSVRNFMQNRAKIFVDDKQIQSYKAGLAKEGFSESQIEEITKWLTGDLWKLAFMHGMADASGKEGGNQQDVDKLQQTMQKWENVKAELPPAEPILKGGEIIKAIQAIEPGIKPNKPVGWVVELGKLLLDNQSQGMTPEEAKNLILDLWQKPIPQNDMQPLREKYMLPKTVAFVKRILRKS